MKRTIEEITTMQHAAEKKLKKSLLQTYLVSLFSLVLCVTMLFGTTMAWFTSEVENSGNEIYVGTLEVDLWKKASDGSYVSLSAVDSNGVNTEHLYKKEEGGVPVYWQPGHMVVETLKVQNKGELDFKYQLNLIASETNTVVLAEEGSVAEWFEVYVHAGDVDKTNISYADVVSAESGWTSVGTLQDILANSKNVYTGMLDETDVIQNGESTEKAELFSIALCMNANAPSDTMGKTLVLNVKLVAYQSTTTAPGGMLDIGEGEIVELTGVQQPMTVSGTGTLKFNDVTITAAEDGVSALTIAPNSSINLVVEGNNVLTGAKNGNGIYVSEGSTLTLSDARNVTETVQAESSETENTQAGSGTLRVVGNAGKEYLDGYDVYTTDGTDNTYAGAGGSGIGGEGTIIIKNVADLVAEGYGVHGFGIGGNTKSITIENTTISNVRGGFVKEGGDTVPVVGDEDDIKYVKKEPEGGAAIGSSYNGATITLTNVNVKNALGGSKSAGIGAMYHTAVNINIVGCKIENVVGGTSAAGIGGSRVGDTNPADQDINIAINNSDITAQGGHYGAGIGSGYDTYCHKPDVFPICTIDITGDSVIKATGGKYAAGVGTGYHAGGLAGEIAEGVQVTAISGENFYKAEYTRAQNVGFGVIDPAREGNSDNKSSIKYNGAAVVVPQAAGTQ